MQNFIHNLKKYHKEEIQMWKLINLASEHGVNFDRAVETCKDLEIEIFEIPTAIKKGEK